jgi:hypothetical protein
VLWDKMAAREMVVVLDFLMGYESFVTFVSSLSLVVDVFSFHLQIIHWFSASVSRKYFQGHNP